MFCLCVYHTTAVPHIWHELYLHSTYFAVCQTASSDTGTDHVVCFRGWNCFQSAFFGYLSCKVTCSATTFHEPRIYLFSRLITSCPTKHVDNYPEITRRGVAVGKVLINHPYLLLQLMLRIYRVIFML